MAEQRMLRVLKKGDIDAIVAIDTGITKRDRREYYGRKIAIITDPEQSINSSIVAEVGGKVIGFLVGDVHAGEFGIPEVMVTIDAFGVAPEYRHKGVASELFDQFKMNMKAAGVTKMYTLVDWDEAALEKFFARQKFVPSKRVNLECSVT